MLKAIHAMESREAAEAKALEVASELEKSKLREAAMVVRDGYAETLTYTRFPREHWRRIRTNNAIERPAARFADARAWSAPSPTAGRPSCS